MSAIIKARNLTKRYQTLTAVNGISFEIQQGECFGLLGPNGAGKTSTIRMITCTSPVSDGELWVDGKDVRRQQRAIKAVLGVVSQADSLDPDLTVIQNLLSYGRFFNLPAAVARQRAAETLELFQLKEKTNQKPDVLSGGMRRRLLIARALLNNPRVLVLDEPTTGLDPRTRLELWDIIEELVAGGTTLLLTTQYLEEADVLADRIAVIDHGRVIAEGSAAELKAEVGGQVLNLRLADPGDIERASRLVAEMAGATPDVVERQGEVRLHVPIGQDHGLLATIVRRLAEADVGITDLDLHRPSLDDVFFALTGAPAEPEGAEEAQEGVQA